MWLRSPQASACAPSTVQNAELFSDERSGPQAAGGGAIAWPGRKGGALLLLPPCRARTAPPRPPSSTRSPRGPTASRTPPLVGGVSTRPQPALHAHYVPVRTNTHTGVTTAVGLSLLSKTLCYTLGVTRLPGFERNDHVVQVSLCAALLRRTVGTAVALACAGRRGHAFAGPAPGPALLHGVRPAHAALHLCAPYVLHVEWM